MRHAILLSTGARRVGLGALVVAGLLAAVWASQLADSIRAEPASAFSEP